MTKTGLYLAAAALGVVTTTALVGVTTFARTGEPAGNNFPAHHQIMQSLTNNNYDAWATAMNDQVKTLRQRADELEAKITQENFDQLVKAQQLLKDGKVKEAKAIFQALGLGGFMPPHPMFHRGLKLGQSTTP